MQCLTLLAQSQRNAANSVCTPLETLPKQHTAVLSGESDRKEAHRRARKGFVHKSAFPKRTKAEFGESSCSPYIAMLQSISAPVFSRSYPLASYPYFGVGSQSCTLAVPPVHQSLAGQQLFSHPSQAKIMADAAQQAAGAAADAL
eukprot:3831794-Rhodomonas_salina.1